jgi:hypothetical protein
MGLNSTALTPVDDTPDVYPPLIGTPVSAADVASGEQALLDNITNAQAGGPIVYVEDKALPLIWKGIIDTGAAAYWDFRSTGEPVQAGSMAGALPCAFELTGIPLGASVTVLALNIAPGAHSGTQPANFPVLSAYKINISTGAQTLIATATDVWNAGAYDTAHPLSLALGSPEVWDPYPYRYAFVFLSEYGANAVVGMTPIAPTYTGNVRTLHSY